VMAQIVEWLLRSVYPGIRPFPNKPQGRG
jgi:hypothetical protein